MEEFYYNENVYYTVVLQASLLPEDEHRKANFVRRPEFACAAAVH